MKSYICILSISKTKHNKQEVDNDADSIHIYGPYSSMQGTMHNTKKTKKKWQKEGDKKMHMHEMLPKNSNVRWQQNHEWSNKKKNGQQDKHHTEN